MLLCGCGPSAPTPALNASEPEGAKLYGAYCVSCHGADGLNDRRGANPAMRLAPAGALSEDAWNALVWNGRGEMPAFRSRLSQPQIRALHVYIQKLTARR